MRDVKARVFKVPAERTAPFCQVCLVVFLNKVKLGIKEGWVWQ